MILYLKTLDSILDVNEIEESHQLMKSNRFRRHHSVCYG